MGGYNSSIVDVVSSVLVNFTQKYAVNNQISCQSYSNMFNLIDISGTNIHFTGSATLRNKSNQKITCLLDTKTFIKAVQTNYVKIIHDIEQQIKAGLLDDSSTITQAVSKIVASFTQENDITNSISSSVGNDLQNSFVAKADQDLYINADMIYENFLTSYQNVINKAVSNIVNEEYSDIKDELTEKSIIIGFSPVASLIIIMVIVLLIVMLVSKFMK